MNKKTAFQTRYRHFECNVMLFRLINVPTIFQHLMNDIFHEFSNKFIVCYLDNILIFSKNTKELKEHVKLVLQKRWNARLYTKLEKCIFYQPQVKFHGYFQWGLANGSNKDLTYHKLVNSLNGMWCIIFPWIC